MRNGFNGQILDKKDGKTLAQDVDRVIDTGAPSVQAIRGSLDDPSTLETTFHRKDDIVVKGLPVENYRPQTAPDPTFGAFESRESKERARERNR